MDNIFGFFGTVLGVFYGGSESLVASCVLVCMIIKLLFVTMTNKYYDLPRITDELQPEIDQIQQKYRSSAEKRTKAISDLLAKRQYPFASFAVYYVMMMIIGVLISLTTHSPEKYIEAFDPEASRAFLFVPDVTQFTFLKLKEFWPDVSVLRYLAMPLLACVLQYLQDAYMSKKSLVSKKWFDIISLPVTFGAAISLPQTFSAFWIVYQLAHMLHIFTNA